MSQVEQKFWSTTKEGDALTFTLTNSKGATVELINIGAGIRTITVPDREGNMVNVTLAYADAESYFQDKPYMGRTPGRFSNRIAKGQFTINGKSYQLPINFGPNSLHGGLKGFANEIWDSRVEGSKVIFSRESPDGEEGYPGNMTVFVTYEWTDDCELKMDFVATTDAPTVINLTNHAYFNLRGEPTGPEAMLDQLLHLNCTQILEVDDDLVPTGTLRPVANTPFDFTKPKKVGQDINSDYDMIKGGHGYDHCLVVDDFAKGKLRWVATLTDPTSGRRLDITSTMPGIQLYTGNFLAGCPKSIGGKDYENRSGLCLECQDYPDAPNHDNFPSTLLQPDETYSEIIIYKFSVEK
eukprot:Protomagalhaensia_wolfi_Nauph_80__5825@NODE_731_length_2055_cov_187_883433_g546_i0_p1_GENE_NODE_731_length_2055_cov_187_883433_g546_i0NODE_731_length_2055_cov_187_883433_g546_i0_p1_ORF_typecomplete_len353_score67_09Aldose_epim/PF01263_20/2_2e90DUF1958/PF09211_10/1_7e02DUF1958/PF09211_10/7_4_NODE_731_length_2055_cov_187_883433_g546_i03161374